MAHGAGAPVEPVGRVEERRPKAPVGSRRIFPPQFKLQVSVFSFFFFFPPIFVLSVRRVDLINIGTSFDPFAFNTYYIITAGAAPSRARLSCQNEYNAVSAVVRHRTAARSIITVI